MSIDYSLRSRVLSADLTTGEIAAPRETAEAPPYRHALVLARLHEYPIGFVQVPYDEAPEKHGILVERVREAALSAYADRINEHLREDGMDPVSSPVAFAQRVSTNCKVAPLPTNTDAPLISVIIATLRNVESALNCVERILKSSYPRLEVIVVNNDPEDNGQLENGLAQRFPERDVVYAHQPLIGLSRARNKGLARAGGDIVVFTDDDVIVDPNWLAHIAKAFLVRPDVTCVTGSILAAELETPAQGWLEQYGGFNKGFSREVFNSTDLKRPGPLYPFDSGRFGSGANMAFRTDVLRSMNGFANDLGAGTPAHGGEDLDILRRVITEGHTLVYEPGALVWHIHRRSYSELRRQLFRYGVGLSATVTKWLLESPRTCGQVLWRLRAGTNHVLRPDSSKNRRKHDDYPAQLTRVELLGMLAGPFAYLRSRRSHRRH